MCPRSCIHCGHDPRSPRAFRGLFKSELPWTIWTSHEDRCLREGALALWVRVPLRGKWDEATRRSQAYRGDLMSNEQAVREIVAGMPGLILTATAAGATEFANQRLLAYFGKAVDEVLNGWAIFDA